MVPADPADGMCDGPLLRQRDEAMTCRISAAVPERPSDERQVCAPSGASIRDGGRVAIDGPHECAGS
jgi:hypothetical protein